MNLVKVGFILLHFTPILLLLTGFPLYPIIYSLLAYIIVMFGITAGYHRYFSHKSYKTSRIFQFVLGLLGTLSLQQGVLWWSANHRVHHAKSDKEGDVHSPIINNFWWAHIGWILSDKNKETKWNLISDFKNYPELVFLNNYWLLIYILYCFIVLLLFGFPYLVWGCFITTLVCYHATFCVNSICHLFGKKKYPTSDESRDNWFVAFLTHGEGFHNQHHYFPSSVKQGFKWYEWDLSYYILWLLSKLGVVWDLRYPTEKVINGLVRD